MNTPYSIFPIGIISLIVYFLTWFLSRAGVITKTFHKKFWNTLLLITFFTTGLLGVILAIKVNYKLELKLPDQLTVWHVDFGLGMVMIAVFHFIWHLNYYGKLFRFQREKSEVRILIREMKGLAQGSTENIRISRFLPVFALGSTAIISQLIILREFMTIFNGNELVIGTILGNWMILTALGAFLGRRSGN